MATTAGLKDFSYVNRDGGTTSPTGLVTTDSTITGSILDLRTTGAPQLLPDEVAIRVGMVHETTTGTQAGTDTPVYQVFALWLETTGTTCVPTAKGERDKDLVAVASDTTTVTGVTTGAPYPFGPTATSVIAVKARYLKLRYKINAAANIAGNLSFGARIASIFSKAG